MSAVLGESQISAFERKFIGRLAIDSNTATAVAGAATVKTCGMAVVTSESLSTAAGADYTLTLTWPDVNANDVAFCSVQNGTNTQGDSLLGSVTMSAGQIKVVIRNGHATQAFNGTIVISCLLIQFRTPVH